MTLGQLKCVLRTGIHPKHIPGVKHIGCGAFRCAWRVGDHVVKLSRKRSGQPSDLRFRKRDAKRYGVRLIEPIATINGWEIQRYFKSLTEREFNRLPQADEMRSFGNLTDFQPANMGRDGRGQPVIFDW